MEHLRSPQKLKFNTDDSNSLSENGAKATDHGTVHQIEYGNEI